MRDKARMQQKHQSPESDSTGRMPISKSEDGLATATSPRKGKCTFIFANLSEFETGEMLLINVHKSDNSLLLLFTCMD